MKFKVGDKARVRKDLEIGQTYSNFTYLNIMEEFKGKIVTIKSISASHYILEEDKKELGWGEAMLEAVNDTKYITIKEKTLKKYQDKIKEANEKYLELALENENLKGQVEAYKTAFEIKE